MHPEDLTRPDPPPHTLRDLEFWVRDHLDLRPEKVRALMATIDAVFSRHERLWQESKQEAIQALSSGFAEKMNGLKYELNAKEVTVSSISHYFEQLVADLTEKTYRDPKTKLMNFSRFTAQLESFLTLEQRGRWCAVGLVDITGFKWYNDALGHAVGDRIIERVAHLLREQARSDDLIAQERMGADAPGSARAARRRRVLFPDSRPRRLPAGVRGGRAVPRGGRAVRLDAGRHAARGATRARRCRRRLSVARDWWASGARCRGKLAAALIQRADKLMYDAKGEKARHIYLAACPRAGGELVEMPPTRSDSIAEKPRPSPCRRATPTRHHLRSPRATLNCSNRLPPTAWWV